jgi:uncharacterized protein YndB with AHSA1/START domain
MNNNSKTQVIKDLKTKTFLVSREFQAPVARVWRAYTESELLEKWWAPAPWRAETKHMNFAVGGYWLYAMVSPENEKHWGRMNYLAIEPKQFFELEDAFCDEEGNQMPNLPASKGKVTFTATTQGTMVEFKTQYASESDLQAVIDMGMEQGITACLEQLAILLEKDEI